MSAKGYSEVESRQLPELKPPPGGNPPGLVELRRTASFAVFAGMVVLLVLAGAVFFLLPGLFDSSMGRSTETGLPGEAEFNETPQPSILPAETKTVGEGSPAEATRQLEIFLALKVQSERENVPVWAENGYQDILDLEKQGDLYFTEKEYLRAQNTYAKAAGDLENLLKRRTAVFRGFLENGYRFLSEEQGREALQSFNRALEISPESEEAMAGAQRAKTLDTVVALYRRALALEQSGSLSAAEKILSEVQHLDRNYRPAQDLLKRVQASIERMQFEQQMSSFFTRLQQDDLVQARQALERLKEAGATNPQVASAEGLLIAREEAALVDNLRKRADGLCAEERWEEAVAVYRQALKIAPEALFAVNGIEQAKRRAELDRAMEKNLSQPYRLREDALLEEAKQLLEYARQFSPAGTRLSKQIDRLETAVAYASAPVSVTLNSDNNTSITIYHVGKIGTFFSTRISLKPGQYTVVGSRNGFHDVREIFVVDPKKRDNVLFIACREPI